MDYNSRYRNGNDSMNTIRTNTGEYGGFDDMDIMEQESVQKKNQVKRASQARGGSSRGRKSKRQMLVYAIIIAIEIIALVVIWAMYFSYNAKLKDGGSKSSNKSEAQSDGPTAGSVNVDNDNFTLTCTKISITADATGTPAALVYFTFTNKTDTPLSMSQVFAPSFSQAGQELQSATTLADDKPELYNKDTAVSAGQSVECAYAATLVDTTSEITITMHDNYETFSDIGYVVVPIS